MKILVTGAAGFIGSVLVGDLLRAGHKVTALDSFKYHQTSLAEYCANPNFTIIRGDCRDDYLVNQLLRSIDVVIPLAAIVGAPACDRDKTAARTTNREAIHSLCALAGGPDRDHIKIILPTTNSGYGIGTDAPCTEDSPLTPVSYYGITKIEAEHIILERENSISFRFATLFGMSSRMRLDLLVNDFVNRAMRDRSICVFEGHARRNYLHVRDACSVFLWAINHFEEMKGRPYNVGLPDANLTKLQLCEKIKEHIPDLVYWEAPTGEDPDKRDYLISCDRILATGWKPQYSLDDGIRELIKGYQILKGEIYGNC